MILGTHSIIYAEDAERARAFFRDVLGYPFVDVHAGWLIFKLPPGELGIHPTEAADSGRQELYLMCDDIDQTVSELEAKGVEFGGPVVDAGFGRLISVKVPGAGQVGLYQPRHPLALSL
ncbi:MAG: VOC family protein [Chloroflexi bacterium]|nr:VOC family protein [Chloroflexota bacterium]